MRTYHVWIDGQKGSTEHLTKGKTASEVQARVAMEYGVKTFQIVARWIKSESELEMLSGYLRDF